LIKVVKHHVKVILGKEYRVMTILRKNLRKGGFGVKSTSSYGRGGRMGKTVDDGR